MKKQSPKLTGLICVFILLLLPALINPATASAGGTEKVVRSETAGVGRAEPLNAPSEMGPIAAGAWHTCALTPSGGVKCWGSGWGGNSKIPVDVSGLASGVSAITAGGGHTCALTTNGGVKCWGGNNYGQLGNDSTTYSAVPVDVIGLSSDVSAITADAYHTCALTGTGGVKCWGWNLYGQLGNISTTDSPIPVDVSELSSGVTAIAAGFGHTCALTTAGGVKCWGFNTSGQLGVELITKILTPVDVTGLSSNVTAISAGQGKTCALTAAGGMKCWGTNYAGQLGNNSTYLYTFIPVDVWGLSSGLSAIAAAYGSHTCALTTTGGAKCWGYNYEGQLGNNSTTDSRIPVDVSGLSNGVIAITGGLYHTCAMLSTGSIKCWGDNRDGQLGNNSTMSSAIPVNVFANLHVYLPLVIR